MKTVLLDRFADGRWLVVDPRGRPPPSAGVLSPGGALMQRLHLGDEVNHVGVDGGDRIWVGWRDIGVFTANADWRVAGLDWPPSSNGVACFGATGTLTAELRWPGAVESACHCYALNVVGEDAWVCSYVNSPLVRFRSGRTPLWWRNSVTFADALAIDERAVLAHGYGGAAERLTLVRLPGAGHGEDVRIVASWTLPPRPVAADHDLWAWDSPLLLTGRGDTIHLIDAGVWHRWSVSDLRASAALLGPWWTPRDRRSSRDRCSSTSSLVDESGGRRKLNWWRAT